MKTIKFIFKRWKLFVVPLVAILLVLALSFFVLIPGIRKIFATRDEITVKKEYLAKLTIKLADLQGLDEVSLKEKVDFSLKAIPSQKEIISLISLLKSLALDSQVYIESLDASPGEIASAEANLKKAESSSDNLKFSTRIIGEGERVLAFIQGIENVLPLININNLKINSSKSTAYGQIEMETYIHSVPKNLGKIESPLPKLTEAQEEYLEQLRAMKTYEGIFPEIVASPSSSRTRSTPFSF